MTAATAWRWCLAAGVIALGCSWGFGRIPGLVACGDTGGLAPVMAFEFARTPAAVAALFGDEPCRAGLVAAQRTGLWLDALGFIPSYAAFLCLAARAAGGRRAWPVVAAVLIAALADEIEGALLFATLRALPGDPGVLGMLAGVVRLKFLLLALGTIAIAALLLAPWRTFKADEWTAARIVGGLGVGYGAVAALRGLFAMPAPGMMTGFAMAWFTLLLVALCGAFWPWRRARRPRGRARPSA